MFLSMEKGIAIDLIDQEKFDHLFSIQVKVAIYFHPLDELSFKSIFE